jgi:hypothetical protein
VAKKTDDDDSGGGATEAVLTTVGEGHKNYYKPKY